MVNGGLAHPFRKIPKLGVAPPFSRFLREGGMLFEAECYPPFAKVRRKGGATVLGTLVIRLADTLLFRAEKKCVRSCGRSFRRNSQIGVAPPFSRFLREGGMRFGVRIPCNATQAHTLPTAAVPAFHYFQLLSAIAVPQFGYSARDIRERTGARPSMVRLPHRRLCGDARARASAHQRT